MSEEQEVKKPPVILFPLEVVEDFELLNNEEAGAIIKAIFDYVIRNEKITFDDRSLQIIFQKLIRIQNDNLKKYQEICARNRQNILKRWAKNDDDTSVYDRIPVDTSGYQSIPVDTNKNKNKNKNQKENKNIKNKTKIENKKEKEKIKNKFFIKKESADALKKNTFDFSIISAYGTQLGASEEFSKRFYEYYEDTGWLTVDGKPIVNFKPLMKKWFEQENKTTGGSRKSKIKIDTSKEGIKNDTRRIFGDI